jgi:hypothetical protein
MLAVLFVTRSCLGVDVPGTAGGGAARRPALGIDHAAMGELIGLRLAARRRGSAAGNVAAARLGAMPPAVLSLVLSALGGFLPARSDAAMRWPPRDGSSRGEATTVLLACGLLAFTAFAVLPPRLLGAAQHPR